MKVFFAPFLVLLLTPAVSGRGQGAAPAVPQCYSGYPNGIHGTFRASALVFANLQADGFKMIGSYELWTENDSAAWKQMLSAKSSGGPLQFTWIASPNVSNPVDIQMILQVHAGAADASGSPTEFWGEVWVTSSLPKKKNIPMFHFTTQAYSTSAGNATQNAAQEATNTLYSYLSNGWTCGK